MNKKIVYFYREYSNYISVFVLAVLIIGGWYFGKRFIDSQPVFRVEPAMFSAKQSVPLQLSAFFDPDGKAGSLPEEEVTDKTDWSTDNIEVGYVGNIGPTKGLLILPKQGKLIVTAKYQTYTSMVSGEILVNAPEITCYPGYSNTVKVNKEIDYVVYFKRIGVPDYTYDWVAPEGQKSNMAYPFFVFKSPGEKIVKITVKDRAGSTISADCKPLTVTK